MNVLIVSGIWPPDVGGPASHAPELAEYLTARGVGVEVVTTADVQPADERYRVHWVSRRVPVGARHALAAATIARAARRADVVYSTGMVGRSAIAASIARTPLVIKITSDPAYERSLRYRFHTGGLEEFQRSGGAGTAALRRVRDFALARAARIVCPSAALRELARGWGIDPERFEVLPNPVDPPSLAPRDELRRRHGFDGPTLSFAGRLAPQKSLDVAFDALDRVDGVSLVLAGDGPERERLQAVAGRLGDRVRFVGPQPRETVFELLAAGDAALLSSSWENFPHMVVEALAVGTPVISTNTGGVAEILVDGENGLLVPPNDAEALAGAISRYFADGGLRERLRTAAVASVARFSTEKVYGRLEQILRDASR